MAELLSLVASIIQVASFGLSISRTLHDYGSSVVGAEKRLKGLDKDIEFTSRIISQLGNRLEDVQVQALVSEDTIRLTQDAVAECDAIFTSMEEVIARIRNTGGMAKWTIYFRDSKIEMLRSNLDRMKGNLNLLMGVIIHGTQMATERPDEATVTAHRTKIRELMVEKEHYTQRYLEEKRKYDELLAKVNSTSTLGSIILISQEDESPSRNGKASVVSGHGGSLDRGQGVPIHTTAFFAMAPGALPSIKVAMDGTSEEVTVFRQADLDTAAAPTSTAAESQLGASTRTSVRRHPRHETEQQSTAAAPFRASSPALLSATPLEPTRKKGLKREKAGKIAKEVAKGTGITIAVVAGVVLFPVTLPVWLYRRRQKSMFMAPGPQSALPSNPEYHPLHSTHLDLYQRYPLAQQHMYYPAQQQIFPSAHHMSPYPAGQPEFLSHSQGQMYASAYIPAELPAPHELASDAAELDLVNRLVNIPK